MSVLKIFDLKCSFNLHRLLKHLESYTSPMLHTELGNCYMQLKHYQEAMDQYGLALWYVLITSSSRYASNQRLMYLHTSSHLAAISWFKGNSITYKLLESNCIIMRKHSYTATHPPNMHIVFLTQSWECV